VSKVKNVETLGQLVHPLYNKGKQVTYDYKIGDLVARKNLEKSGFPKERWSGPWIVVAFNSKEGTSFKIVRQSDPNKYITTANAKHMRLWFTQEDREQLVSKPLEGGDDVMNKISHADILIEKRIRSNDVESN